MRFLIHTKSRLPITFISTKRLINTAGKVTAFARVFGAKLQINRAMAALKRISTGFCGAKGSPVIFKSRRRLRMKLNEFLTII